ncbi:MAG TPA: hypothetical protein VEA69_04955 [Tepidisphaeraceae bacterium]|nr:hypothetical protein [Tepidisphaeraceae bacterium]
MSGLPEPMRLEEILSRASASDLSPGWLFLPIEWQSWGADTLGYMIAPGDSDEVEDRLGAIGYDGTLDDATIVDVVRGAGSALKLDTFDGRLEAFVYYYRHDAFLPQRNAPEPPPPEVALAKMDRAFYDSLGTERVEVPCRAPGCGRGAVKFSAFCRVHQFEQVQGRTCPFND